MSENKDKTHSVESMIKDSEKAKDAAIVPAAKDVIKPNKSGTVFVEIAYPADYKGPKFHKDGDIVEMSPESAQTYVSNKIGKVKK